MPEKFIDNLATRGGNGAASVYILLLVLVSFVALMSSIVFEARLNSFITPYLYPDAIKSWLFYTPASFQSLILTLGNLLLISLVLTIIVIGVRRSRIAKPYPAYDTSADTLRRLRPGEALATIQPNMAYSKFAELVDDTAFLNAIRPPKPSAWRYVLLPILLSPLLLAIIPGIFGAYQYKDITSEAVRLHAYNHTMTYSFRDAKYAYAICYDTGKQSGFGYHIVFPNKSITLWEAHDPLHDLGPAQVINRIAQIDTQLQRLHVPIHRMPTEGSFLDAGNDCINHWAYVWKVKDTTTIHRLVFGVPEISQLH